MTNKIFLSFNRLYTLKDGDYHGATLTYRIKHGDDLLAEGEIKGKSLSQFIRPVEIEEMELTKPLSVDYVCTGNVEDIAVSLTPTDDRAFRVVDGGFYIKDCFIRDGWLDDCKKRFGDSEPMPFGGFPGVKECQTHAVSSDAQSIINHAITLREESISDQREMKSSDDLTAKVESIILAQLKPGGILWRK
jgi:hypothetical protein